MGRLASHRHGHAVGRAHLRPLERAAAVVGRGGPRPARRDRAGCDGLRRRLRHRARHGGAAGARVRAARCSRSTPRRTWWRWRASGSVTARRCGARTCWTSISTSRSTRSSRRRRCIGSPTTIGCGRVWPRRCAPAGGSRSSAAARATSTRVRGVIDAVADDAAPRARRLVALGLRRTAGDGAATRAGRLHRGSLLAGGTSDVSAGRRRLRAHVDPRRAPARGCPRSAASRSPPPSSQRCACPSTTCG